MYIHPGTRPMRTLWKTNACYRQLLAEVPREEATQADSKPIQNG
jgi:hypothetical protein